MEDLEQQQKIKEAAYQFVEALTESYGANIDFVAAQKNQRRDNPALLRSRNRRAA
jgi:hypothetical protein